LRYISECSQKASEDVHTPEVNLKLLYLSSNGLKGHGAQSSFTLTEGQSVTFVLRTPPDEVQAMIFGQDDKNKGKPSGRERERERERENGPHSGQYKLERRVDDPYLTKELLSSSLQAYIQLVR
jgi:hypothetical protein